MTIPPWAFYVIIALFLIGVLYSMITIGQAAAAADNKAGMKTAITNVTIVNSILTLILGITAGFYTAAIPTAAPTYTMVMLHVALLLSVISVSISSLQQLS